MGNRAAGKTGGGSKAPYTGEGGVSYGSGLVVQAAGQAPSAPSAPLPKGTPLVAVCGDYQSIHILRLDTGQKLQSVLTGRTVHKAMIPCHLQGKLQALAVAAGHDVIFLDPQLLAAELKRTVKGHTAVVFAMESLPPGFGEGLIATGSADKTVRVWKSEGTQIAVLEGHEHCVTSVCCAPSKGWVMSGSNDESVRVWDLATQQIIPDGVIKEKWPVYVTMFGGEAHPCVISGSQEEPVNMYSLDTLRSVRTFNSQADSPCLSLLLHPTREHLFYAGCFEGVYLWDMRKEDRCVEKEDEMHTDGVSRIVSVGPGLFASCSLDGSIKVWTEKVKPLPVVMKTPGNNHGLVCLAPFPITATPSPSDLLPDELSVDGSGGGDQVGP